jgi:phage gp46-like protein
MTDLALIWNDADFAADIGFDAGALLLDDGLRTAVIISLFTDARAAKDDPLPEPNTDRRGWWGDVLSPVTGWEIGSKLWLLSREKQLPSVLNRARDYAAAALAWMIADQIAAKIDVEARFPTRGWLALAIFITRPDGPARQRFDFAWNATEQQLRAR